MSVLWPFPGFAAILCLFRSRCGPYLPTRQVGIGTFMSRRTIDRRSTRSIMGWRLASGPNHWPRLSFTQRSHSAHRLLLTISEPNPWMGESESQIKQRSNRSWSEYE
ncbi:hypothetical protein BDW69DRAFT_169192 [Aspergillus filifer]